MSNTTDEKIKSAVREAYGSIARRFAGEPERPPRPSCCGPSQQAAQTKAEEPAQPCCGPSERVQDAAGVARFYSAEEISGLPDSVTDASLGCGNPLVIADLKPGEVVLDLGSGGGIDCFLAARRVGPQGRVIGLDMTPDMIRLAQRNAKKTGAANVEFRFGEMEDIPLPDESVDAVISNCVINLSPDKDAVFAEAYRVLRPGGRLSVSDIVVDGDLPEAIRGRLDAWAGCLAGALDESVYLSKIQAAGFERIEVVSRDRADVDATTGWDDVEVVVAGRDGQDAKELLRGAGLSPHDLVKKVASIKVRAFKAS